MNNVAGAIQDDAVESLPFLVGFEQPIPQIGNRAQSENLGCEIDTMIFGCTDII